MPSSSRFAVAIHVLTLMARAGDEPLKSEQVAKSVNTNPVVIRRLLCALARAQLVTSQTGAAGGSKLARPPRRITLLEVYEAIGAGEIFSLHRQPPDRRCFVGMNIETVLGGVLEEVGTAVESVLGKITIANVLERLQPCPPTRRKQRPA
ncbi:MAG TPA: Rrf2 family transcriptional regulator [Pyrinomonadaceae bacterium]